MRPLINVDGWRERARRRLPKVAFDFVDGGADDEVTLRRNRAAFDDLALIPRVLRGVGEVTPEIELFGHRVAFPVLLSPAGAGFVGGQEAHRAAESAAGAMGTIAVAHRGSLGMPLNTPPQWLQLYLSRDRKPVVDAIERAKSIGISTLVYTVDTAVAGNRERDVRNRLTVPLRIVTPRIALDAARRPRWLKQYFADGSNRNATVERGLTGRIKELKSLTEAVLASMDSNQMWEDLEWLRRLWDGPLLAKGVMCGEDAALAVEAGCQGVIVSNHGGRQLDGVPAPIELLPEIVAAVGGRAEVLLDSGVRRGTDVVKALCLGAKACLVGRPWVFSAIAGGEEGVKSMLEQFRAEIVRALQLMGARSPAELGPEFLRRRPGAGWVRVDERVESPSS